MLVKIGYNALAHAPPSGLECELPVTDCIRRLTVCTDP